MRGARLIAVLAAIAIAWLVPAGTGAFGQPNGRPGPAHPHGHGHGGRPTPQPPGPLQPTAGADYLAARTGDPSRRQAGLAYAAAVRQASNISAASGSLAPGSTLGQIAQTAWQPVGPAPVTNSFYGGNNAGRITSVAVIPSGPNAGELVAGAAGGGVWTSTNGGSTWATNTDGSSTGLAIGAVAVDPSHPNTIYAGTGEDNGCADCYVGEGVLESTDAGHTWTVLNPGNVFTGVDFASLVIDPHSDAIYAGTSKGLYKSVDGGSTWTLTAASGAISGLALDPSSVIGTNSKLYLAENGGGLDVSTDGASTFTAAQGTGCGTTLPSGSTFQSAALGVGTVTVAFPTGDQTVYAGVYDGTTVSLYRSTDGGCHWTNTGAPHYSNPNWAYNGLNTLGSGDQGWYDNALAVDPKNPSHVIAVGMGAVETTNGGSTWSDVNGNSGGFFGTGTNRLHPDFHAVTFTSYGKALFGCDGGVFEYDVRANKVLNINGDLDVNQFYAGASAVGTGASMQILGGTQDVGLALYNAGSAAPDQWPSVFGGDGAGSAINPANTAQQFGAVDSNLYETTTGWTTSSEITPTGGLGDFAPPMALDDTSGSTTDPIVYYGGTNLYQTTNPSHPTPSWTQLTFFTGVDVTAIAIAPSNHTVVYVGFSDGTLGVVTNATTTPTFTTLAVSPPTNSNKWITGIAVDPADPTHIVVSYSYSFGQYTNYYANVTNVTSALTTPVASDVTGNLPTLSSNAVQFEGGLVFVATDVGVYVTGAFNGTSTSWTSAGVGLPQVQVYGLSTTADGQVIALTHGRGAWLLPASPQVQITTSSLPVADASTAYSSQLTAIGGTAPYTWTITSGALPSGLTLSTGGLINGTTSAVGVSGVTFQATDSTSLTATRTLQIVSEATTSIGSGTAPSGMAVNAGGTTAYVADYTANNVSVVNLATHTVTATVAVGTHPDALAITPDGTRVFVSNEGSGTVSVINTSNNTVAATITVGAEPAGIVFATPSGTSTVHAFVADFGSAALTDIDTSTDTVAHTLSLGTGSEPTGVAASGANVYVADANYTAPALHVVSASTSADTVSGSVSLSGVSGADPAYVAVDGSDVYVAEPGIDSVGVVDVSTPSTPRVVSTVAVGTEPFGLAVASNHLYVSNAGDDTVTYLSVTTPSAPVFVSLLPTGLTPDGVAAVGTADEVVVANQVAGTATELSGVTVGPIPTPVASRATTPAAASSGARPSGSRSSGLVAS